MNNIIIGYELARDYINNHLPKAFPYKIEIAHCGFLKSYNSYGYCSKSYENQNKKSGELRDSKVGTIFLKSDLDAFLKKALKPVEISNPKEQLINEEDITIDYICSCVLVTEAAKHNTSGYTTSSFTSKLLRDFPTIKLGLPFKNTASTALIHKSYLKIANYELSDYQIADFNNMIIGYDLAKNYINNNLPKGFPYKVNVTFHGFLSLYQSYGYYSKCYKNNCRNSNRLINSKKGSIFLKTDLDSFIKDALKPIEIRNPKEQLINEEDITIDYICSCVLVTEAAKNNTLGFLPKSFYNKILRDFPTIKLGLPMGGQLSTQLIHTSYLKPNNRKNISYDAFKKSMLEMINHPSINKIKNYTPVQMVKKLKESIGETNGLYELTKSRDYIFFDDNFDEFKDKFLKSITIYNCKNSILGKDDVIHKKDINLNKLNEFMSAHEVKKIFSNIDLNKSKIDSIMNNISYIRIPFFNRTKRYYKISSILTIEERLKKDISNKSQVDTTEYYPYDYWIEKFDTCLPKFLQSISTSKQSLRNRLKKYGIKNNVPSMLSQDEFNKLIQGLYGELKIINFSDNFEVPSIIDNLKSFNIYELNKKTLDEYVNSKYLESLISLSKGTGIKILKRNKFPCISWNGGYYFRKDLLEKFAYYRKSRIPLRSLAKYLTAKYIPISTYRVMDIAINNGIEIIEESGEEAISTRYILQEHVHIIEKEIIEEYEDTAPFTNIANYMYRYMERNPILNIVRVRNTVDYFKKHIIIVNNNVRVLDASKRKKSPFRYIYKIISTLKKELYEYTVDEINELLNNIEENETQETLIEFTSFHNYIMKQRKELARLIIPETREKTPSAPYPISDYFCLLGRTLELLHDKNFVINKLYGNRYLSSSLLYILSHYIACWRTKTIVTELPNANLSLIGFDNAEDFLDWYKKPNNKFTDKMGELICTDVENKVIRVRKIATKNNGRLLIYISKYLYKYYGLLLCICEANRCLYNKNAKKGIQKKSMFSTVNFSSTDAGEYLNKFIPNILVDFGGRFSNRSANKSFETYISEKSEEWNLGIGYLMSAVARGHKIDAYVLGETTKIYINKNIDNTSFEVFSSKVFSGIKYNFMSIIYDNFDKKTTKEKLSLTNNNELSNLQIENMLKSIAIKKEAIDKFFNTYLTTKAKKRETLFQVIYGSNCYAKHDNTKCLLRAYNSIILDDFVCSDTSSSLGCIYPPTKKDCIGCPLLIAEIYFLFELGYRLKDTLNALENCNSKIDKMIQINRIKDLYFPIIFEAISEFGEERVNEILDIRNMLKLYENNKKLIAIN
ncbi:hypothetical protein [Clostridium perfringens]|uniref:hypothetical protein n=1 Tax=Clostridium perfringens TaxID=1502 RepID=UPI0023F63AF9|nr:hypothetical protein [Clostridium perfringens]WEV18186.1 hypothetical protein PL323_11110 [Clostridium perfringens D]